MKKLMGILVVTSIALTNTVQAEGDIETGRALSTQCSACHGNEGMSLSEQWPNIAGQKESYLVSQLQKYKSGDRKDPTMSAIVGPLNDQNILDLAAYFASSTPVASYSLADEILTIPYVAVGKDMYRVEMGLESFDGLVFFVTDLEQR